MRKLLITLALVAQFAAGAESTAELLQKAIYTQDTLGDLEGAMRIYRQIMSQAKDSRTHAAQAQFRLGQCLLRKGATEEARETFQKLIDEYPEQKELVAKAKELAPGDLRLSPEPWADGEMLVHSIRLPAGLEIGSNIFTSEAVDVGGKRAWRNRWRQYIPGSDGYMNVDAERDTFRPIRGEFRHTLMGTHVLEYEPGVVRTRAPGQDWKRRTVDGVYYDNTQAVPLLRRLPLALGFKIRLPISGPMGDTKLMAEVTARETVTTPAGKFDTFKLEVPLLKQTFWIATDASRYPVKMEVGGALLELVAVKRADRQAPAEFRDADSGLSASLPAGWNYWLSKPKPDTSVVHLLEPESIDSLTTLGLFPVEAKNTNETLEADFKERLAGKAKELEGYQPRSVQIKTVNGKNVASVVGDFREKGVPKVELVMWTQGGGKRTILSSRMPAANLASLQSKLEAVFVSNVR